MFEGKQIKVIIPVLNEANSIAKVLEAIPKWVDEVIVADNGSSDGTDKIARDFGARVVYESRRGYGSACLAGMAKVGWCDIAVFLDGDFSDFPQQMNLLVEPIVRKKADMVIGSRTTGGDSKATFTIPQRFGNALACSLMNLFWRARFSDLGPFRAVRWSSLLGLGMADTNFGWTVEMQIKAVAAKLRILEVPVKYRPRIGESKISGTIRGVLGAGAKILATIGRFAACPPSVKPVKDRLIIFSRYPMPGKSKTRLIPAIGSVAAAGLQRKMTTTCVAVAREINHCRGVHVEVCYAGGNWRKMRRWLGGGISYAAQDGGDLGLRMKNAFKRAFGNGCQKVVLAGTDCPKISNEIIQNAFDELNDHELVLAPSTDGGYCLIGLSKPANVFSDIEWSTSSVLEETLKKADSHGLKAKTLEPLVDIDEPEDLEKFPKLKDAVAGKPYISIIIPTLNEAENVEDAITSACWDGVEIIIVDGGSSDETKRLSDKHGVKVICSPVSRAMRMNAGAKIAQGEVLLFLHADTQLPKDYARLIFNALSDARVVGGAFEHKTDLSSPAMGVIEWFVDFRSKNLKMPYGDQALFVRKDVFDRLGGFENLSIGEDWSFVRKLKKVGKIEILPAPAITSGRRWKRLGVIRTTIINRIVIVGLILGVSPRLLGRLYRRPMVVTER